MLGLGLSAPLQSSAYSCDFFPSVLLMEFGDSPGRGEPPRIPNQSLPVFTMNPYLWACQCDIYVHRYCLTNRVIEISLLPLASSTYIYLYPAVESETLIQLTPLEDSYLPLFSTNRQKSLIAKQASGIKTRPIRYINLRFLAKSYNA